MQAWGGGEIGGLEGDDRLAKKEFERIRETYHPEVDEDSLDDHDQSSSEECRDKSDASDADRGPTPLMDALGALYAEGSASPAETG